MSLKNKRPTVLDKAYLKIDELERALTEEKFVLAQTEKRVQEYQRILDQIGIITSGGRNNEGVIYTTLPVAVMRAFDLANKYQMTMPEESRTVAELRNVIKMLINSETTLPPRCDCNHHH